MDKVQPIKCGYAGKSCDTTAKEEITKTVSSPVNPVSRDYSEELKKYGDYIKIISGINVKTSPKDLKIIREVSEIIANCEMSCINMEVENSYGKNTYDGSKLTGIIKSTDENISRYVKYDKGKIVSASATNGENLFMYCDMETGMFTTVIKDGNTTVVKAENLSKINDNTIYIVSKSKNGTSVEKVTDEKLLERAGKKYGFDISKLF